MTDSTTSIDVFDVFERAAGLSRTAGERFLDRCLAGRPTLRAEVDAMLAADREERGWLDGAVVAIDRLTLPGMADLGRIIRSVEPPDWEGRVIGGRYRLAACFARGGSATVFAATDAVTGEPVAVKVLGRPASTRTARREAGLLRILRLPGVVRVRERGRLDGQDYIVTDRFDGTPFPGRDVPCRWEDLAPVLDRLLHVVESLHGAGVLHRDLKPENVLVDAHGDVGVLDVGIASRLAEHVPGDVAPAAGTPGFSAPEQLGPAPPSASADVFALAAMTAWCLTGRVPPPGTHDALAGSATGIPDAVRRALARALAARPDARTATVSGLREDLGLDASRPRTPPALPMPDRGTLLDRLERGRSVRIGVADPATFRTLVDDLERDLVRRGRTPLRPRPGVLDFESLRSVPQLERRLASARTPSAVRRALELAVRDGFVLLVDSLAELDPATRSTLESERERLAALCLVQLDDRPDVIVPPLDRDDLARWLRAENRISQARDDAARLLLGRSGGFPDLAVRELRRWTALGFAREADGCWEVTREAVDALRWHTRAAPLAQRIDDGALPEAAAVTVWKHVLVEAAVLGNAEDDWLPHLRRTGWLRPTQADGSGRWAAPRGLPPLDASTRHELGEQLLEQAPEIVEDATWWSLFAEDATRLIDLVLRTGPRLLARGRAQRALGLAHGALDHIGGAIDDDREFGLLRLSVRAAIRSASPAALQLAAHHVERRVHESERAHRLETLVLGALRALGPVPGPVPSDFLPPFEDPVLERERRSVGVVAAQRWSRSELANRVRDAAAWAATADHAATSSAAATWTGWLAYEEGDFGEALASFRRATELASDPAQECGAHADAAAAAIDGFRLPDAREHATRALALARELRLAPRVAHAEILLRQVLYREEHAIEADDELVDSLVELGLDVLIGNGARQEAAFALRRGRLADVRRLAGLAARHARLAHDPANEGLALALLALAAPVPDAKTIDTALAVARELPQRGVSIQIAALVSPCSPLAHRSAVGVALDCQQMASSPDARGRREVLSLAECWNRLGIVDRSRVTLPAQGGN